MLFTYQYFIRGANHGGSNRIAGAAAAIQRYTLVQILQLKYFYSCTIENQLKEEKKNCSIGIQFDYTIPLLGKRNTL